MTAGIDFNWLVFLFIELAVLMPVVLYAYRRLRPLYYLFMGTALVSSVIFLKYNYLVWYRYIMWLPWSLALAYTIHLDGWWKNRRIFWTVTVLLLAVFILTQQVVLVPLHHSLRMQNNKYPPNLYHLSYSFFAVNVLYFLSKAGVFERVRGIIRFYSVNSYTIYFIHILVIYVLTVFMKMRFTWVTFFLAVITLTTLIQLGINMISAFLRYRGGRQSGYSPAPGR